MNSLGFDKKEKDTKVIVAMSGGVDSSVAAVKLKKEGYDVNWWVLDSKDYGVPQTRRRVFIYGSLKKNKNIYPIDPPKIIRKILNTRSILEKNVDKKYKCI